MIDIRDITPGESYACQFRVKDVPLDEYGRLGGEYSLADLPIARRGEYTGLGILMQRDLDNQLVRLKDQDSNHEFVCGFDDIWDIDTIEWEEPFDRIATD